MMRDNIWRYDREGSTMHYADILVIHDEFLTGTGKEDLSFDLFKYRERSQLKLSVKVRKPNKDQNDAPLCQTNIFMTRL